MFPVLMVAIGGALGSVFRYWVSIGIYGLFGRNFPYGTLIVNVTGCLLMGFLYVFLLERFYNQANELRSLLLIGLLGGYTTFSTFSIETLNLFENGEYLSALMNILLSGFLCLGAVWLGAVIGRQL